MTEPADHAPADTAAASSSPSTSSADAAPAPERRGTEISVLAFVDHDGVGVATDGALRSRGLDAGLALVSLAEDLGYDAAYVRSRHLQRYLSAPLPFLAAAGQRTSRIGLGTAVIPLRFETAGRLAEDIATTDLLVGGRLRIGVSSGYSAKHDAMNIRPFGRTGGDVRELVDRVLHDLLDFTGGEVVSLADTHVEDIDPGTPLRVTPQVEGLRERLSYGAATERSAELAGGLGMGMQLNMMQPDDGSGRTFEELQAHLIEVYREARVQAGFAGSGHVSVARLALPVRDDADLVLFDGLITGDEWRQKAHREGTVVREIGGEAAIFGRVHADEPEVVAEALREDPAVLAADELIIALPMDHPADLVERIATTFATDVAPLLR